MIAPNLSCEKELEQMVRTQLVSRDIVDKEVLRAMGKVPRHLFIPEDLRDRAYEDGPLPIGEEQTISQPYIVAYMVQTLSLKKEDKILEIGTGSGYQTAVLAEILDNVYTVEVRPKLAENAMAILNELGYGNRVKVHVADGSKGHAEEAPFNGIIVAAATYDIPEYLTDQLAEGGKLIIPIGDRNHQTLVKVTKKDGSLIEEKFFKCIFVPLVR